MKSNRPLIQIDLGKLKSLHTGLGQVSLRFGKMMAEFAAEEFDLVYLVPEYFVGRFGDRVRYETLSTKRRYLPFLCPGADLWHAIHQDSAYFPSDGKTPYLLTIHDLNFLDEKNPQKAARRLKKLQQKVDRACAVAYISEYTQKIARENLLIGNRPEHVIYNGVSLPMEVAPKRPAFAPPGKFLFAMGVIKEKKNFHVLIDFLQRLEGYSLILAGDDSDPYASMIRTRIEEVGLGERMILPGIVNDLDRAWLYTNCEAFLFPSRVEGFGLPVIEAMLFGAPVFTSRYASLGEIGGKHACYFESFDPDEMAALFQKLLPYALSERQREARKKYAQSFSWKKNVEAYLEIYRKILVL